MPNKVLIPEILKSLAKKLKNKPSAETWITYEDFHDALMEDEVYTSDPSIRNAWVRVRGSEYCTGQIPGRSPRTKKLLLELGWIRADLGLEITEENKNKNTDRAAGEAY